MDNLLDVLVQYGIMRLDAKLQEDEEFIDLQNETEEAIRKFNELELDEETKLVVDRMVTAYNTEGAYYGEMAYNLGILDCVKLLKELKIFYQQKTLFHNCISIRENI